MQQSSAWNALAPHMEMRYRLGAGTLLAFVVLLVAGVGSYNEDGKGDPAPSSG
jgi:hypothetical protein